MLSYEPGINKLYGFSLARFRIILLGYVQSRALARARVGNISYAVCCYFYPEILW